VAYFSNLQVEHHNIYLKYHVTKTLAIRFLAWRASSHLIFVLSSLQWVAMGVQQADPTVPIAAGHAVHSFGKR
jgi:hypothetical protein